MTYKNNTVFTLVTVGRMMLLMFLFLLHSCNSESANVLDRYFDQVVRVFTNEMKHQYGLICVGSGGSVKEKIEIFSIRFYCYQHVSIEEARALYVTITDRLIEIINDNERIRPFLRIYPFPAERADISISFVNKNNSECLDGSVTFVCQGKGKLHFSKSELQTIVYQPIIDNADGSIIRGERTAQEIVSVDLHNEPYEEAVNIVHAQKKAAQSQDSSLPSQ